MQTASHDNGDGGDFCFSGSKFITLQDVLFMAGGNLAFRGEVLIGNATDIDGNMDESPVGVWHIADRAYKFGMKRLFLVL